MAISFDSSSSFDISDSFTIEQSFDGGGSDLFDSNSFTAGEIYTGDDASLTTLDIDLTSSGLNTSLDVNDYSLTDITTLSADNLTFSNPSSDTGNNPASNQVAGFNIPFLGDINPFGGSNEESTTTSSDVTNVTSFSQEQPFGPAFPDGSVDLGNLDNVFGGSVYDDPNQEQVQPNTNPPALEYDFDTGILGQYNVNKAVEAGLATEDGQGYIPDTFEGGQAFGSLLSNGDYGLGFGVLQPPEGASEEFIQGYNNANQDTTFRIIQDTADGFIINNFGNNYLPDNSAFRPDSVVIDSSSTTGNLTVDTINQTPSDSNTAGYTNNDLTSQTDYNISSEYNFDIFDQSNNPDINANLSSINVDNVIQETYNGSSKNITSNYTLNTDEALEAGLNFVGEDYTEIGQPGSGVFRSADGTRQFRIDDGSLNGSHAPGVPHVHLEIYEPGANKPRVNNHIPLVD